MTYKSKAWFARIHSCCNLVGGLLIKLILFVLGIQFKKVINYQLELFKKRMFLGKNNLIRILQSIKIASKSYKFTPE